MLPRAHGLSILPVIAGLGGINSAGRVSGHHALRRIVIDALGERAAGETYASLAGLMGLDADPSAPATRQHILDHTLIRRIECFEPENVACHRAATMRPAEDGRLCFVVAKRGLPERLPDGWQVRALPNGDAEVCAERGAKVLFPDSQASRVTSAGQAPTGFDPASLYPSRNHPRGLQLTVFGASDAVRSVGVPWDDLKARIRPDEFAVYAGSAMGQLDAAGTGGMFQAPLTGKRITSKQVPLGLAEMPTDFVNAYVVGSVGATGAVIGACATFLYNLKLAVDEIRAGRVRVALVGGAEAPIVPEVVEGYRVMGALAEDDALMALDGARQVDNRRACRPFGENCGFTLAEAAVFAVVMDDALALDIGAEVHCAAPAVFVNADGYKKSIPGPGVGNYLTVAKALALARAVVGEESVRRRSYIHAHGTGTPQNRVTESHILNELAKTFGIERWPVAAVKAFLGHSLAPASGDQLACAVGSWAAGWLPGITTIDAVAADVHASHLGFETRHVEFAPTELDMALINSKGFGGNNATGVIFAPHTALGMLKRKHGAAAMAAHRRRNEAVRATIADYDAAMTRGEMAPIYRFGDGVLEGEELALSADELGVPGYRQSIPLRVENPFPDMTPP